MPGLFLSLPAHLQEQFLALMGAQSEVSSAEVAHKNRTSIASINDKYVAIHACANGNLEVVKGLLEAGMDINCVHGSTTDPAIPLTWAMSCTDPDLRLALVDFLLEQGADPNFIAPPSDNRTMVSPMHEAACVPEVLERLIQKGGDIHLIAHGTSLLDHWVLRGFGSAYDRTQEAMRAMDVLLSHGLDRALPMQSGKPFLVQCWGVSSVRKQVVALIDRGFDPRQRGTAKGAAGASLLEHLEKKAKSPKASDLAREVLAHIHAQTLDVLTPQAVSLRPSARM